MRKTLRFIVRHFVDQVVCEDINKEVDEDGFLKDWKKWKPEVAVCMAQRDKIEELNDDQWLMILTIREFMEKNEGEDPNAIYLKTLLNKKSKSEWNLKRIREAFGGDGFMQRAWQYAGALKKPSACTGNIC